jgi:hypothetical protein
LNGIRQISAEADAFSQRCHRTSDRDPARQIAIVYEMVFCEPNEIGPDLI